MSSCIPKILVINFFLFFALTFILRSCIFSVSSLFFWSFVYRDSSQRAWCSQFIILTSTIFGGYSQLKLPKTKNIFESANLSIRRSYTQLEPQPRPHSQFRQQKILGVDTIKMHLSGLILASLATVAVAAPTSGVFNDVYNFDSSLEEFYTKVSTYIAQYTNGAAPTCDMSKVSLPSSKLPAPKGSLKYVAIGRGTQVCQPSLILFQLHTDLLELHLRRLHRRHRPRPNRCRRKPL